MAVMAAHQGTTHCTETTAPVPAGMNHVTPVPTVMNHVAPVPTVMNHVNPVPAVVRHIRPKAVVPDGRTVLNLDLQVVTTQHSSSHRYGFLIFHFLGGN